MGITYVVNIVLIFYTKFFNFVSIWIKFMVIYEIPSQANFLFQSNVYFSKRENKNENFFVFSSMQYRIAFVGRHKTTYLFHVKFLVM